MRFSVPVEFNLTALRIGAERKQSGTAWSLVEIEVPEASGDDVPVVLRWNHDFNNSSGIDIQGVSDRVTRAIGPEPIGGNHVRKGGASFYKPVVYTPGDPADRPDMFGQAVEMLTAASVEAMLAAYASGSVFGVPMPTGVNARRLKKNGGDGLAEFARVEHHDLERVTRTLQERMRNMYLLIDGTFYERCPEPELAVFRTPFFGNQRDTSGTLVIITTAPNRLHSVDSRHKLFPIEEHAEALKMANRRNAAKIAAADLAQMNARNIPRIDPDNSIYAEDVVWMLRSERMNSEIAHVLGNQKASAMSMELYSAYSKLVISMDAGEDDARFDTMSEAFAEVARECRGTELDSLADMAETGLAILEARPVSLGFANASGSPAP